MSREHRGKCERCAALAHLVKCRRHLAEPGGPGLVRETPIRGTEPLGLIGPEHRDHLEGVNQVCRLTGVPQQAPGDNAGREAERRGSLRQVIPAVRAHVQTHAARERKLKTSENGASRLEQARMQVAGVDGGQPPEPAVVGFVIVSSERAGRDRPGRRRHRPNRTGRLTRRAGGTAELRTRWVERT